MKKIIMLGMILMTMLISLGGCFVGYPVHGRDGGHDGGGGHHRGGGHDRHRGGGYYMDGGHDVRR